MSDVLCVVLVSPGNTENPVLFIFSNRGIYCPLRLPICVKVGVLSIILRVAINIIIACKAPTSLTQLVPYRLLNSHNIFFVSTVHLRLPVMKIEFWRQNILRKFAAS